MKRVRISITDFAKPAPLAGSIDVMSGFGRASELGIEIHQEVQAKRKAERSEYESEVPLTHIFKSENYEFEVSGRADGIFQNPKSARIEEIKTTFNIYELSRRIRRTESVQPTLLDDEDSDHPYVLQLKTYGYIYSLVNGVRPSLSFHLVSTRDRETLDVEIPFGSMRYEAWLKRRLMELDTEAREAEKRARRRRRAAENLTFPFPKPRRGQVELIATIEGGFEQKRPMLIQAPTGLGKTVGVLYPALKEALARGQQVIYATPKNSQHQLAEEAVQKIREAMTSDIAVKSLSITAKSKLCFKNEPICNPDFCEYAKDHYTKVARNELVKKLAKKKRLTARTFEKLGREFKVCPFELQLDAAKDVETIVCDYNYVFAPRSAFGSLSKSGLDQDGLANLVIDEAHCLPARAMDFYSPSLSVTVLERMRDDVPTLAVKFRNDVSRLINDCIAVVRASGRAGLTKPEKIQAPAKEFIKQDDELRAFLSSYLASDVEVQPNDLVMRLSFYWSEFTGALAFASSDRAEFFTTFHPHPATIKITCCDASEMLKSSYGDFAHTVAFSATLKPFDYYSQLMGLAKPLLEAEFASPFDPAKRKLLIIPQISSKFSERERNYPKIADAISKIIALKPGNYFAFFPSFDFLENVRRHLSLPVGFQILQQERGARHEVVQSVLETLRGPGAHLFLAVQGGVFSEGIDYPGEMAIGAFVVGPPLPLFDLEREKKREYYERTYGTGFDYAYAYPAMAKSIQAAGRVIRNETDRGLIVLMDDRFTQAAYAKSMPRDWFSKSPHELVSNQILQDIAEFWSRSEAPAEAQLRLGLAGPSPA